MQVIVVTRESNILDNRWLLAARPYFYELKFIQKYLSVGYVAKNQYMKFYIAPKGHKDSMC